MDKLGSVGRDKIQNPKLDHFNAEMGSLIVAAKAKLSQEEFRQVFSIINSLSIAAKRGDDLGFTNSSKELSNEPLLQDGGELFELSDSFLRSAQEYWAEKHPNSGE